MPAIEEAPPAPNEPGIPESVDWELWDKERDELVNTFPTEDEAVAARNALMEKTGASEDQFIVGPIEWKWGLAEESK